jgi:putative ABC transport system substrate-binding protein
VAAAWPLAARAQQGTQPRAGLLWVASERVVKPYEESMRAGFRDLNYTEGRNFLLDVRYANGDVLQLPSLIDDLIALKPDVLLGNNQVAALMKAKTSTIPIVLNWSYDPVEIGLVQSLSHPGGNVTGMATLYEDLLTKHVELAGELVPGMSRIGFINDASDPSAERFNGIAEKAARAKSAALTLMPVRDARVSRWLSRSSGRITRMS